MASRRQEFQEDARFRILKILQLQPDISQRELARAVGISAGSAHYLLNSLIEKGLVKLGNFADVPNKRHYVYLLTPRGMREKAAITKRFLARKIEEYEALREEIDDLLKETGDDTGLIGKEF